MGKRNELIASGTSRTGLIRTADGTGYAVDWTALPASDHFFMATNCELKRDALGLKLLFGCVSAFDEEAERYDLAVEVHFPIREAATYLYQTVFKTLSSDGKLPFYDSVKSFISTKHAAVGYNPPRRYGLPANRSSSFRIFPANFASWSFAGTQGLLEFFEIPPELVHLFVKMNKVRPGAGVKPVISIIMDTPVMLECMERSKEFLVNEPANGVPI